MGVGMPGPQMNGMSNYYQMMQSQRKRDKGICATLCGGCCGGHCCGRPQTPPTFGGPPMMNPGFGTLQIDHSPSY